MIIDACAAATITVVAIAVVVIIRATVITSQAERFVAAGDYESAIELYEENGRLEDADTARLDWAKALEASGDYESAIGLYEGLGMSDEVKTCFSRMLANLEVGDTVMLGSYEQDGNTANGAEAIEWVALAKEGDKTLLVSRYALDCQPYNTSRTSVTWEDCTLRSWLNGSFLSTAFTEDEQALIDDTHVTNEDNGEYDTPGGNPTVDKVFLLSIDEVEKCFSSDDDRACTATAHAKDQGVWTGSNDGCGWWLRSPGSDSGNAAPVNSDGDVYAHGCYVDSGFTAVRPALWVNP